MPADTATPPASWRSRIAGTFALTLALGILCAAWSVLVPQGNHARADITGDKNSFTAAEIASGAKLYAAGCATCHGSAGQGGVAAQAPSLIGVGAAAADFQVTSGRMPLAETGAQADRKPSPYSPEQQRALVAFVASLGAGPQIPDVDLADGDLSLGAMLFRGNCANCHNFAGQGGALTAGKAAPAITGKDVTAEILGTAVRSGPEQMPVFSATQLNDHDINSIAAYLKYLRDTPDPGGNGLGRLGPIPEGLVIAVFGIGVLCAFCLWIGKRSPRMSKTAGAHSSHASDHAETHH